MKPRNVLFITSDQQQVGAMGCADPSFVTPHLDALAGRGVRFTKSITTAAQCTPARASWETGRYPHEVGVNQIGHTIRPDLPMVAKVFAHAGYETVHFGKWHLFTPPSLCGYQVTEYRTDGIDTGPADMNHPERWSALDAGATAMAIHYIRDSGAQPFFMALSYYSPHPGDIKFELIRAYLQGAHRLRLKGVVPYRELYNVPLIVVDPTDKGGGRVSDRLVSSAAVPGTLLCLAGLPVPTDFTGGVLPDVFLQDSPTNQPAAVEEHVFFEHYKAYWGFHPFYGVQTTNWKYAYYYQGEMEEMYDLMQDPDELVNVAEDLNLSQIKKRLRSQVSAWWEQTGGLSVTPLKAEDVSGAWSGLV